MGQCRLQGTIVLSGCCVHIFIAHWYVPFFTFFFFFYWPAPHHSLSPTMPLIVPHVTSTSLLFNHILVYHPLDLTIKLNILVCVHCWHSWHRSIEHFPLHQLQTLFSGSAPLWVVWRQPGGFFVAGSSACHITSVTLGLNRPFQLEYLCSLGQLVSVHCSNLSEQCHLSRQSSRQISQLLDVVMGGWNMGKGVWLFSCGSAT